MRAGVGLMTVSELPGRSSVAMTAIYPHPFSERKAQAVEFVPLPGEPGGAEGATKWLAGAVGG